MADARTKNPESPSTDPDEAGAELAELASDWAIAEEEDLDEGRHASWLELFFDLVYVLAIAQLAAGLYHRLTPSGALVFAALCLPVWWAWVGVTFYETRYQCGGDLHRLLILVAMVVSTVMALSLRSAFNGHTAAFALAYAGVRMVLIALYAISARRGSHHDEVAEMYMRAFAAGVLVWIISAFLPVPIRYVLWGLGLAIDIGTPIAFRQMLTRHPVDGTHMPERFGAFVIIVLGEAVVSVGIAVSGIHWDASAVIVGLGGFAVVASVWWTYFDLAAEGIRRTLTRRGSSGILARDAYAYWHFPLVVGLVVLAVGIQVMLLRVGGGHASAAGRWTLCGGIAAYLVSVTGAHLTTTRNPHQVTPYTRLLAAGVLVLLAAAGGDLSPPVFVAGAALVTVCETVFETGFIRARRAGRIARSPRARVPS